MPDEEPIKKHQEKTTVCSALQTYIWKNRRDKYDTKCKICKFLDAEVVNLPCGHGTYCIECFGKENVQSCAFCKERLMAGLKVYPA